MTYVSVVTPCFNEADNVVELYTRIKAALQTVLHVEYEHIFIDNASQDGTVGRLRELAAADPRVKVIVNARNFGHIRSPMHGLLQASGEAVILMASDLQDPPELIPAMIKHWEDGARMVLGVKVSSDEARLMYWLRTKYYNLIRRIADTETFEHFTGFGLFDRSVIEIVRSCGDRYPYFRGLIAEIGLPCVKIPYHQVKRSRGLTKNNFYTLYDLAILGITNSSKIPLRLFTAFGAVCAFTSLLVSIGYFVYKVLYWDRFSVGIAPVAIGLFFFGSVQLVFVGILAEYVAATHTQVLNRPLVVEVQRINFGGDRPPRLSAGLDARPYISKDAAR
jgi:glycosyltransferase involved in cell wall biosynthesis